MTRVAAGDGGVKGTTKKEGEEEEEEEEGHYSDELFLYVYFIFYRSMKLILRTKYTPSSL